MNPSQYTPFGVTAAIAPGGHRRAVLLPRVSPETDFINCMIRERFRSRKSKLHWEAWATTGTPIAYLRACDGAHRCLSRIPALALKPPSREFPRAKARNPVISGRFRSGDVIGNDRRRRNATGTYRFLCDHRATTQAFIDS